MQKDAACNSMPYRLPHPSSNNRALLSAACVALAVLSLAPLAASILILRHPITIRSQDYPSLAPTTGPYTAAELRWAESQLLQYSGAKEISQGGVNGAFSHCVACHTLRFGSSEKALRAAFLDWSHADRPTGAVAF